MNPCLLICLVFVLATGTFLYRIQIRSWTPRTTLNEIERALVQLPTCSPTDRSRQRALLLTLEKWSDLAHQNDFKYWISFNTLISFVQTKGLFPFSTDVSITINADDTPQLIALSNKINSANFTIKIHPDWKKAMYLDRSYYLNDGIQFVAPNGQFINRENDVHIDIYPSYDYEPWTSTDQPPRKLLTNLTEYDAEYGWITYPRDWTYPLQNCVFSSIRVLCPAQPRTLVENLFGSNALNHTGTVCVDGIWIQSDEF